MGSVVIFLDGLLTAASAAIKRFRQRRAQRDLAEGDVLTSRAENADDTIAAELKKSPPSLPLSQPEKPL